MVLTISNSLGKLGRTRVCALLGFVLLAGSALAQKYTPPPPPLLPGPCVPTKKEPCDPPPNTTPPPTTDQNNPFPGAPESSKPVTTPSAAAQNPFPGEPGDAPKPAPPAGDAAQSNPFPGAPESSKPAPANDAAQSNPFPGEPPEAPKPASSAAGSSSNPFPGEPAESSSSSSSSGSSTTSGAESAPDPDAPDPNKPLTRTQRRHLAKVEDLDYREAEDIKVSQYYASTGDFKAAYLRAQDAVKTIPDDPDAHFQVAVTAERLKNTDEAIKEYTTYLKMDPEGIHAKAARKALAALQPAK